MKVYIDVKVNGHWISPMVEVDYSVDPIEITGVRLGDVEIIQTLDKGDMFHLEWCAEQDYKGTGVKRKPLEVKR